MSNIIKDESLLSNISNISIMIKPNEGSSFFNFSLLPNNNEPQQSGRLCEVKLEDIFPSQEPLIGRSAPDNNSMLDKIIKKEERDGSIMPYFQPIMPQVLFPAGTYNQKSWRITQQKGVSEDEAEVSQEQIQGQIAEGPVVPDKPVKNQTKNIPKNYGKAIISFMEKYQEVVERVCDDLNVPFEDFFRDMLEYKKTINTISDLRKLWTEYKYSKCMRILSSLFLRRYSLSYIFNSRICNFRSHIKYRHRLTEAVCSPHSFRHIKEY